MYSDRVPTPPQLPPPPGMSLMIQVAGVLKAMAKDFNVAALVRMAQSLMFTALNSKCVSTVNLTSLNLLIFLPVMTIKHSSAFVWYINKAVTPKIVTLYEVV